MERPAPRNRLGLLRLKVARLVDMTEPRGVQTAFLPLSAYNQSMLDHRHLNSTST